MREEWEPHDAAPDVGRGRGEGLGPLPNRDEVNTASSTEAEGGGGFTPPESGDGQGTRAVVGSRERRCRHAGRFALGAARTWARSPRLPMRLRNSTGPEPVASNQGRPRHPTPLTHGSASSHAPPRNAYEPLTRHESRTGDAHVPRRGIPCTCLVATLASGGSRSASLASGMAANSSTSRRLTVRSPRPQLRPVTADRRLWDGPGVDVRWRGRQRDPSEGARRGVKPWACSGPRRRGRVTSTPSRLSSRPRGSRWHVWCSHQDWS